jgi:integrase
LNSLTLPRQREPFPFQRACELLKPSPGIGLDLTALPIEAPQV